MGVQIALRVDNLEMQRHQSICRDTFQIWLNVANIPDNVLKNGIVLVEGNFAKLPVVVVCDQHLEAIPEVDSSLQNPGTVCFGAMLTEPESSERFFERCLMIVVIIRARSLVSIE